MYNRHQQLPPILEPYRYLIEATIKPYLKLDLIANENLTWWQSKFPSREKSRGNFPYLPKGIDYPKTSEGEYLHLLAQINLAEAPHLEGFPETGILQFYITNDDSYGLPNSEDIFEQNSYRILYFKKPDFNEEHLTTDFKFLPEKDNSFLEPYPEKCSAIQSTKGYVPISKYDYDFYDRIFSELIDNGMIKDGMEDLYEELSEACESILTGANGDIQMGGYRFHVSDDPRCCYNSEAEPFDTLLLSIGLVENGSLFFYIQGSALAKCDFSKVLYAVA